jgi:glycosyltransferase involved in cell wall biosynthesis
MYGAIAAGLARRPAIYTAHFPSFVTDEGVLTTARNHIAELVTCRFSTMIVSCSQSMADEFLRRRLIPPAKIMTIYNGVSETHVGHSPEHLRTELSIPADHHIILAVGRFTRQKGFDLLLDAAAPLLEDLGATTVILLGDGEERNRLESQARKLGIGDRVRFTGFRGDTAEFYALADTVVVPSRYEIFPLVPLEAMMAEKPVVASDLPVLREALEPDRTGIVVPNTPASLYGALRRVLTCPEWARELAAAARSVALDRFSAGRMADEYRRLYESVAGAAA